jgi:hypothetical protein
MGGSSNSAANAATSFGTAGFSPISFYGQSQSALTPALIGSATASSVQMAPGLGSWSTNAALMSTSSIQVGQVSIQAGQIVPYFQIIRNA